MEAARHFASVEKGGPVSSLGLRDPDAGKTFFKCGGNCSCVIEADGTVTNTEDINLPQELQNLGEAGAYCKCGEGWSCVTSKIEEPEPTKAFYDCAGSCNCVTEP